jgi:hypothetical protein
MKTKHKTRTRTFTVPTNLAGKFYSYTEASNLKTDLTDVELPHNIIVEVIYEEDQKEEIMKLIELLDDEANKWVGEPREQWLD